MLTLRSYVGGRWIEGGGTSQTLLNPATEAPLASASSAVASAAEFWRPTSSGLSEPLQSYDGASHHAQPFGASAETASPCTASAQGSIASSTLLSPCASAPSPCR